MSHNSDKRPSAVGRRVAESKEAFVAPGVADGASDGTSDAALSAASGTAPAASASGIAAGFSDTRLKQSGASEKTGTPRLKREADPAASSNAPAEKPAEKPSVRSSAAHPSASHPFVRSSSNWPSAVRPNSETRMFDGRRVLTVIGAVAVVLALVAAALAWNQWLRYDDAADIQGAWAQEGSATVITITDSQIVMTEEVSYDYTLDTFAKTITFSFEGYSGTGSYAFSSERNTLVITEETDGETVSTTLVRQ